MCWPCLYLQSPKIQQTRSVTERLLAQAPLGEGGGVWRGVCCVCFDWRCLCCVLYIIPSGWKSSICTLSWLCWSQSSPVCCCRNGWLHSQYHALYIPNYILSLPELHELHQNYISVVGLRSTHFQYKPLTVSLLSSITLLDIYIYMKLQNYKESLYLNSRTVAVIPSPGHNTGPAPPPKYRRT